MVQAIVSPPGSSSLNDTGTSLGSPHPQFLHARFHTIFQDYDQKAFKPTPEKRPYHQRLGKVWRAVSTGIKDINATRNHFSRQPLYWV